MLFSGSGQQNIAKSGAHSSGKEDFKCGIDKQSAEAMLLFFLHIGPVLGLERVEATAMTSNHNPITRCGAAEDDPASVSYSCLFPILRFPYG